jgi:hypothetical protein
VEEEAEGDDVMREQEVEQGDNLMLVDPAGVQEASGAHGQAAREPWPTQQQQERGGSGSLPLTGAAAPRKNGRPPPWRRRKAAEARAAAELEARGAAGGGSEQLAPPPPGVPPAGAPPGPSASAAAAAAVKAAAAAEALAEWDAFIANGALQSDNVGAPATQVRSGPRPAAPPPPVCPRLGCAAHR